MKAIRIHQCGGADALQYQDVATPAPGPGEALVRIAAAGVNYIDVQFRTGGYKPPGLPFTPGSEAAGTVTAIGDGVADVAVGDRVAWAMVLGAYAEYAVVKADRLVRLPDAIDFDSAAAVMLQGMTAHYLTRSTYPVRSGDTVLVHAAAHEAPPLREARMRYPCRPRMPSSNSEGSAPCPVGRNGQRSFSLSRWVNQFGGS